MTDTEEYRVTTKEFSGIVKQVHDDLRNLLKLTSKVYASPAGVTVDTASGKITLKKRDINKMWTTLLDEVTGLKKYFNASLKKKPSKKAPTMHAFSYPLKIRPEVVQFFTTANMGYFNPLMNQGYSLDSNGNLVASQYLEPTTTLNTFLSSNELFTQGVARRTIVQALLYIYIKQNLLAGLSTTNAGKPYIEWVTLDNGATDELYNAFRETFDEIGRNNFTTRDVSKLASAAAVKNAAGDAEYYPRPSKEVFDLYAKEVAVSKKRLDDAMAAAKSNKQDPLAILGNRDYQVRYEEIAARVAPNDQALSLYARLDQFNALLRYVNKLHDRNFDCVNKVRTTYQAGMKKGANKYPRGSSEFAALVSRCDA